jgi:hypothetical protein
MGHPQQSTLAALAGDFAQGRLRPPLHEQLVPLLGGVNDAFGFLLGDDVQAHQVG